MKQLIQSILFVCIAGAVYSQDDVQIYTLNSQAYSGSTIHYPVYIEPANHAVAAISFQLYYNPNILEAASYTAANGWTIFCNLNDPGKVYVSGIRTQGQTEHFIPITIKFDVLTSAGTSSQMELNVTAIGDVDGTKLNSQQFDASISIMTSCPENLNLDNEVFEFELAQANKQIQTNSILTTNGYMMLKAGNNILLKPKFEIYSGATFEASIDGCQ